VGIEVAGNNQRPPLAAVQLNTPKMEITNTRMRSDTWRIVSGIIRSVLLLYQKPETNSRGDNSDNSTYS
jgi:hypothetical protein